MNVHNAARFEPYVQLNILSKTAGDTIPYARTGHPRHTVKSIPVGELVRARKN